jgi:type VI secretion system secreted protein Hcp
MVGGLVLALLLAAVLIPGQSARAAANASTAAPALDIFAKIDTIPGDSTDAQFVHQIPVQSVSFASTSLGGAGGRPNISPITFTAAAGSDSPLLFMALAQRKVLNSAVFSFVHTASNGTTTAFQTYTLSHCTIVGFHQTAPQNGVDDEVQIAFTKVTYAFSPQKADGSLAPPISGGWDITGNKPA